MRRKSRAAVVVGFALLLVGVGAAPAQASFGYMTKWGTHGYDNPGEFNTTFGVAVDSVGNVYATDTGNHRIQKFDADGDFRTEWGSLCGLAWEGPWGGPDCDGRFFYPRGIAIGPGDSVYVTETSNHRVQKFDSEGNLIAVWGGDCDVGVHGLGGCDGRFRGPYGVATDSGGNVYVADSFNHRIQKFDQDGNFLARWGRYCDQASYSAAGFGPDFCDGRFLNPTGVAVDTDGNVYIADAGNHRIQKLDQNGNYRAKWGSHCEVATQGQDGCDGDFHWATNVAVDSDGMVLATDLNSRVQRFGADGAYVTKWGSHCEVASQGVDGCDGLFRLPYGIATNAATGDVYVADSWNHRIERFGEGSHGGPHANARHPRLPQGGPKELHLKVPMKKKG